MKGETPETSEGPPVDPAPEQEGTDVAEEPTTAEKFHIDTKPFGLRQGPSGEPIDVPAEKPEEESDTETDTRRHGLRWPGSHS